MSTTTLATDHEEPRPRRAPPAPLHDVDPPRTRSPAEEARTLTAGTTLASLATVCDDGSPWASLVTFATLDDGTPVLMVSTLAEHGRNLHRDPRASLLVAAPAPGRDPLDSGRVTLLGRAEAPTGREADRARAAFRAVSPAAGLYGTFGDFSLWVLRIERVRWVGGYGRMSSATGDAYRAAEPDPVAPAAGQAVRHLNEDHADVLLLMAQRLAGYPDASAARCAGADRYGLDLRVETPRGAAQVRVSFVEPVSAPGGLRSAAVALARRARDVSEP